MRLSLELIKERLGSIVKYHRFGLSAAHMNLPRPIFYSGEAILNSNTLYISIAASLPAKMMFMPGSSLVCIDVPPNCYHNETLNLLVVDKFEDILLLGNKIHDIYNTFDSWEFNLQQSTPERNDIQYLLEISDPIFENGISVMDSDFKIIAQSPYLLSVSNSENELDEFGNLPIEQVNLFKNDELYQQIQGKREVFIYPQGLKPYKALCKNIFWNDQFIFRIVIHDHNREFRNSDFLLLDHFAHYISQVSEYYSPLYPMGNSYLLSLFQNIIMGNAYNQTDFDKELIKIGWSHNNVYCIAYIQPSSQDRHIATLTYFCNVIMRDFKKTFAFIHGTKIIVIINKVHLVETEDEFFTKIFIFIREGNFRAGFSDCFVGLNNLKAYCHEAEIALEIGTECSPNIWIHKFSDYVFTYILNKITDDLPSELLVSPILSRLEEYDRENGTNLLKTLQVYVNNKLNAVQTAKDLFIHRSTMTYRLERIKEIGQTDFRNPDELLHIQLSMRLLTINS